MISTLPITNSGISMIIMKSIRDHNGLNTQLKLYCTELNDLKKPAHVSVDNCSTQSLSIILIQYRNRNTIAVSTILL